MNTTEQLNDMSYEDVRAWLKRALNGEEPLPRLTPDESHYLGILRLEKSLKHADYIRSGCRDMVREFCAGGKGQIDYIQELLSLASTFKDYESIGDLRKLALRFPKLPKIDIGIRLAVLAALVDAPQLGPSNFWAEILKQDPEKYAALVLSGSIANNPAHAIDLLPALPNVERIGQAAALKLDLAWDALPLRQRFHFVQGIQEILPQCGDTFAVPVREWVTAKQPAFIKNINSSLNDALLSYFGQDIAPRAYTPKLCPCHA